MDAQRRRILKRLDAFDAGPTEDGRRAERQAAIQRAIEAEQDLKWGRLSAGIAGGMSGRSVLPIAGCERVCDPLSTTRQSGERCASVRLIHPLRFGCDMGLGMRSWTVEAGRAHGHQYPHTLVTVG